MQLNDVLQIIAAGKELSEEIKGIAEEARPLVKEVIELLQSFGPEIKSLLTGMALGSVDITIAMIKRYEEAGFSTEQSIRLVINNKNNLAEGLKATKAK